MKSTLFFAQSGCFLPFLIILNLGFGWLFLKPGTWLLVELVLFLLLLLNFSILTRKIVSFGAVRKSSSVVDIEAEVVEDDTTKKRLS